MTNSESEKGNKVNSEQENEHDSLQEKNKDHKETGEEKIKEREGKVRPKK